MHTLTRTRTRSMLPMRLQSHIPAPVCADYSHAQAGSEHRPPPAHVLHHAGVEGGELNARAACACPEAADAHAALQQPGVPHLAHHLVARRDEGTPPSPPIAPIAPIPPVPPIATTPSSWPIATTPSSWPIATHTHTHTHTSATLTPVLSDARSCGRQSPRRLPNSRRAWSFAICATRFQSTNAASSSTRSHSATSI